MVDTTAEHQLGLRFKLDPSDEQLVGSYLRKIMEETEPQSEHGNRYSYDPWNLIDPKENRKEWYLPIVSRKDTRLLRFTVTGYRKRKTQRRYDCCHSRERPMKFNCCRRRRYCKVPIITVEPVDVVVCRVGGTQFTAYRTGHVLKNSQNSKSSTRISSPPAETIRAGQEDVWITVDDELETSLVQHNPSNQTVSITMSKKDSRFEQPGVNEALLPMASQAVLTLVTMASSPSTSSRNPKILFGVAVVCNVIAFFATLFSIFMCKKNLGASQITRRLSYAVMGCGLLAASGMLLPNTVMLWASGLACLALVVAMASALE